MIFILLMGKIKKKKRTKLQKLYFDTLEETLLIQNMKLCYCLDFFLTHKTF